MARAKAASSLVNWWTVEGSFRVYDSYEAAQHDATMLPTWVAATARCVRQLRAGEVPARLAKIKMGPGGYEQGTGVYFGVSPGGRTQNWELDPELGCPAMITWNHRYIYGGKSRKEVRSMLLKRYPFLRIKGG